MQTKQQAGQDNSKPWPASQRRDPCRVCSNVSLCRHSACDASTRRPGRQSGQHRSCRVCKAHPTLSLCHCANRGMAQTHRHSCCCITQPAASVTAHCCTQQRPQSTGPRCKMLLLQQCHKPHQQPPSQPVHVRWLLRQAGCCVRQCQLSLAQRLLLLMSLQATPGVLSTASAAAAGCSTTASARCQLPSAQPMQSQHSLCCCCRCNFRQYQLSSAGPDAGQSRRCSCRKAEWAQRCPGLGACVPDPPRLQRRYLHRCCFATAPACCWFCCC